MSTPEQIDTQRRKILSTCAIVGGGLAIAGPTLCVARTVGPSQDVMRHIPGALHGAIRDGSVTADLARYFDEAARTAVASGAPLYVPAGVYTMRTWSPPAHLTVATAGTATVFRQLVTRNPQRFIEVGADGVRLWPGGAATIDGGMTRGGANASSFNSGVRVHAGSGVRINTFACGDIHGRNIGGDVLETGAHTNGYLGDCRIGRIYGDNIYRNIVSITAGRTGTIDSVIQTGGVGLLGLDFEPDPSSGSPIEDWRFGTVRCHRVTFAGDPAVPIGRITGERLELSYTRYGPSRPPFDYAGVNAARAPTLFEVGVRYRNCRSVVIDEAVIEGFPRGAIIDIGETQRDSYTGLFRCNRLQLIQNGALSTYEIAQHKTRKFSVGLLVSQDKPNNRTATLIGGTARDSVAEIETARIDGLAVASHTGRVQM